MRKQGISLGTQEVVKLKPHDQHVLCAPGHSFHSADQFSLCLFAFGEDKYPSPGFHYGKLFT